MSLGIGLKCKVLEPTSGSARGRNATHALGLADQALLKILFRTHKITVMVVV